MKKTNRILLSVLVLVLMSYVLMANLNKNYVTQANFDKNKTAGEKSLDATLYNFKTQKLDAPFHRVMFVVGGSDHTPIVVKNMHWIASNAYGVKVSNAQVAEFKISNDTLFVQLKDNNARVLDGLYLYSPALQELIISQAQLEIKELRAENISITGAKKSEITIENAQIGNLTLQLSDSSQCSMTQVTVSEKADLRLSEKAKISALGWAAKQCNLIADADFGTQISFRGHQHVGQMETLNISGNPKSIQLDSIQIQKINAKLLGKTIVNAPLELIKEAF